MANTTHIEQPIAATVPGPGATLVRVESPSDAVDSRVQRALLAVVALGVVALGAALVLALIQARTPTNLPRPFKPVGGGRFERAAGDCRGSGQVPRQMLRCSLCQPR